MRTALPALAFLACAACIVVEDVPEGRFAVQTGGGFLERCEARRYDRAVGCALACGSDARSVLRASDDLLRFAGAEAVYAMDDGETFEPRCGTASWQACQENAFGGVQCEPRTRRYCAACAGEGVALTDRASEGVSAVFPAEVIDRSVLPSMMEGRFLGEPGSCLAACIAVVTRPGCGRCGEGEGCLATEFGDVCHPVGAAARRAPCGANAECASLECDPLRARCE